MNILEIAPRGSAGRGRNFNSAPITYAWHKSKTGPKALCIRFLDSVLSPARYVDGDKMRIEINTTLLVISISPDADFPLCKTDGRNSTNRKIQMKYMGVEKLEPYFPDTGKPEALSIVSTRAGQIICQMPERAKNN
jgi:hypothetical protein